MLFDPDQQRSPGPRRCPNCGTAVEPGHRFCISCGADVSAVSAGPPGAMFCRNCTAPLQSTYRYCTRCGIDVSAITGAPYEPVPGSYPMRFDVQYPERLSRWLIFVKLILAIPQLLIIYALYTVVGVVTFISFFAILFTRRYPKGLFDLVVGFNRWIANVVVYLAFMRDEYPPFSTDRNKYAVAYEVEYPERLNRWLIFVKWLLVIPQQFVLYLLVSVAFLFWLLSWFAILFTGRYPRTFFEFNTGIMRWYLRIDAYTGLMRDEYPPLSFRADARPGTWRMILVSFIAAVILVAFIIGTIVLGSLTGAQTETVHVSYSSVTSGQATAPVKVEGARVVLEGAEDPYAFGEAPDPGYRFIAFALDITNEDNRYIDVDPVAFELDDTTEDNLLAYDVISSVPSTSGTLRRHQSATITVIFEVESGSRPETLTYSPLPAIEIAHDKLRYDFR